jgi:hypothetical protein
VDDADVMRLLKVMLKANGHLSFLEADPGKLRVAVRSKFDGATHLIALNRAGEFKCHVHRVGDGDFP